MKNKFISTTLILMVSGLITKLLGFIIRIIYTRNVGLEGIALYSLVMPTYSLLITFAILSMPFAISKLVAEQKSSNKKILSSALIIMLTVNAILIFILYLSSNFIAVSLLKAPELTSILKTAALSLPFISISSILKGYYFGVQQITPNAISNIIEQIIKLLLIVLILPYIIKDNLVAGINFLFISNIICEFISILILMFCLPKKTKINQITPSKDVTKNLLQISIPSISGRLIGNIGYFFEPILLTNILLSIGVSKDFITTEYGIYNAYSISLLLMPSFFIAAISQSLLPEITKFYSSNNHVMVKRRLYQGIAFSLLVGITFSAFIYYFRDFLLSTIYHTTSGSDYIKVLAPFFILYYLEAPLSSFLIAINKVKESTKITVIGVFIKLIIMSILAFNNFGIYSLLYAEIINIIYIVTASTLIIKKEVK